MNRILLIAISTFLLAAFVGGCAGRRGNGGADDDDTTTIGLAGLDIDGDGKLTSDDISGGDAGIYDHREGAGGSTDSSAVGSAMLYPGDGYWSLEFDLGGSPAWRVSVWFEDPNMSTWELDAGPADFGWANATDPAGELLAWSDSSSGTIEITDADQSAASGWFDGEIILVIADQFESPTGDSIRIDGFAFNQVPYALD